MILWGDDEPALEIAERCLHNLRGHAFKSVGDSPVRPLYAIGVTRDSRDSELTAHELINRSCQATGIARTEGDNRVVFYNEHIPGDTSHLPEAEAEVYSYVNKERCEELVEYRRVDVDDPEVMASEALALAAWQLLGCRDAGRIDLRSDEDGVPQLLELNPLAGLHPEHSDLPMICTTVGIAYDDLMAAGSYAEARKQGTTRLEGKLYEVQDGDIINFRFNV